MRWWWLMVLLVGCSGGSGGEHESTGERERESTGERERESTGARAGSAPSAAVAATPAAPEPPSATPAGITLHFAWPAPAEADVHVVSEHDFGDGVLVSATYGYHLAVRRAVDGYVITRTGLTLEDHAGSERLRLGNVIAQDVTQHVGELHIDADGTHIAPIGGFDPIDTAAHEALADAEIGGPLADAVLALGRAGWETLNVVDYDTLVHEWNGRTFALGIIQPADAMGDISATRILSRAAAPCDESAGALATCVELVRTEQGERAGDRVEHVYTLLAEAATLRPHRFQHESRTDSETANVHYAETWTTTFTWRPSE